MLWDFGDIGIKPHTHERVGFINRLDKFCLKIHTLRGAPGSAPGNFQL